MTPLMRAARSGRLPPKKKGGRSPLSVLPSRLILIDRPVFFACGLDCTWDERTRPVKEWEGPIFRPTLFLADTGMSAGRRQARW